MSATLSPPTELAVEDQSFTIPGVAWSQYVAINDALGDHPSLRMLYLDGSLTFLSPARIHEWSERALDKILLAISVACGIEMDVVGSTTLRKELDLSGLEGDEAYYLRQNVALMGGPKPIDLTVDPPPDLAIEVENSNQADKSMAIYARLGVPEVWRHDVRRGTLGFWALQADGTYQLNATSLGFPFLTPADVMFQMKQAEEIKSQTRWFAQLTDWVRDVIRSRLDPA